MFLVALRCVDRQHPLKSELNFPIGAKEPGYRTDTRRAILRIMPTLNDRPLLFVVECLVDFAGERWELPIHVLEV